MNRRQSKRLRRLSKTFDITVNPKMGHMKKMRDSITRLNHKAVVMDNPYKIAKRFFKTLTKKDKCSKFGVDYIFGS